MITLIFSNIYFNKLYILDEKLEYLHGIVTGTIFFTRKDNVKLNDKSYSGAQAYDEFKRVFDEVDRLLVTAFQNILPRYSPTFFKTCA